MSQSRSRARDPLWLEAAARTVSTGPPPNATFGHVARDVHAGWTLEEGHDVRLRYHAHTRLCSMEEIAGDSPQSEVQVHAPDTAVHIALSVDWSRCTAAVHLDRVLVAPRPLAGVKALDRPFERLWWGGIITSP